jgi:hypothetical protein
VKGKLAIVFSSALLLIAAVLIVSAVYQEEAIFPGSSGEFEIQGLTWRSIAYYYHPGIYEDLYNEEDNLRLIYKAKDVGANYLMVRAFYNCAEDGSLIGDDEAAETCLSQAIATAHDYDISIFLTPFVESMEFWPERNWQLSVEDWTEAVIKWAAFAEENDVEMFAPGFELGLIMDKEQAADWFPSVLPQIRQVYSGRVVFAEVPYGEQWQFLDERNVFSGYDGVGITVFPWKDYDGVHDLRGYEDLSSFVEENAAILEATVLKYNADFGFVATLGMDDWYGAIPTPDILAEGYGIAMDIFKEHNISGLVLHLWASEHDQLGDSTEVEEMLKARWTLNPD